MTPEALSSSRNLLHLVRIQTNAIGVGVSFGKDSLATLELCCAIFPRVEGYYLFRVRGLSIVDEWSEAVRRRFGVTVRMYPHFDLSRCYRNAVLQPHWKGLDKAPRIDMAGIERAFRADANVEWLALGWRRNDSFSRALIMKSCAGYDHKARRVFPLRAWRRQDVLAFLESRRIPLPPGLGRKEQGGLDFHPAALETLKQNRPDDWAKWLRDFPLSGMQLLPRPALETDRVGHATELALRTQTAPPASSIQVQPRNDLPKLRPAGGSQRDSPSR